MRRYAFKTSDGLCSASRTWRFSPLGDISCIHESLTLGATSTFPLTDWLALGVDLTIDSTRTLLVQAGQQGCDNEPFGDCRTFAQDVWHQTIALVGTAWLKPYYAFGPARAWAGLGVHLGYMESSYRPSPVESRVYGQSKNAGLDLAVGVGVDARIDFGGGKGITGTLGILGGAPGVTEEYSTLPGSGTWPHGVEPMLDPWRLALGIGLLF
ncbi:MAG: hypothetical protein HYZ28_08540 [Myxococcales bacterium]|nr:hypothetical protein [Myxococcales bacterium]